MQKLTEELLTHKQSVVGREKHGANGLNRIAKKFVRAPH